MLKIPGCRLCDLYDNATEIRVVPKPFLAAEKASMLAFLEVLVIQRYREAYPALAHFSLKKVQPAVLSVIQRPRDPYPALAHFSS
ncbi:MAG: hypothetical protein ACREPU_02295 [Rhodanobacteraceae bacterium]